MRSTIYGEIYTRLVNLPTNMRGFTIVNNDGDYIVFLNANLTYEMQQETYEHELRHIYGRHFNNDILVESAESNIS